MRLHPAVAVFSWIIVFFVAAASVAEDPNVAGDPNAVAVTVDGFEITEGALAVEMKPVLDKLAARSPNNPDFVQQYAERLRKQVLDGLIVEHLLDEKVKAAGITVSDQEVDEHIRKMAEKQSMSMEDFKSVVESLGKSLEQVRKRIARGLGYQKLMESQWKDRTAVTEQEAEEYYRRNTGEFHEGEQVRASHILIKPEQPAGGDPNEQPADPNQAMAAARRQAAELLARIKEGEDFEELARTHSSCPSASRGGDLGFGVKSDPNSGTRGTWVKPFEEAAFALEEGHVSDIVETRFGCHIIKVTDHKPAQTKPFEEVEESVIEQLRSEKQRQLGMEFIEKLKAEAEIVYPDSPEQAPAEN